VTIGTLTKNTSPDVYGTLKSNVSYTLIAERETIQCEKMFR